MSEDSRMPPNPSVHTVSAVRVLRRDPGPGVSAGPAAPLCTPGGGSSRCAESPHTQTGCPGGSAGFRCLWRKASSAALPGVWTLAVVVQVRNQASRPGQASVRRRPQPGRVGPHPRQAGDYTQLCFCGQWPGHTLKEAWGGTGGGVGLGGHGALGESAPLTGFLGRPLETRTEPGCSAWEPWRQQALQAWSQQGACRTPISQQRRLGHRGRGPGAALSPDPLRWSRPEWLGWPRIFGSSKDDH